MNNNSKLNKNKGKASLFLLLEFNSLKEAKRLLSLQQLEKRKIFPVVLISRRKKLWFYSSTLEKNNSFSFRENQSSIYKDLEKALRKIYREQTFSRFEHTVRVIETARRIAQLSALSEPELDKLLLASAYHDLAKNWSRKRLNWHFKRIDNKKELLEPWALHGPVASNYLQKKEIITDPVILMAIYYHTKPISSLDKVGQILVIADKIEPFKEKNFLQKEFQSLWEQIEKQEIETVFKYLLANKKKS